MATAVKESNGAKRKDSSALREGDWICAECDSHNYSARVTCYRCSLAKEKSEFVKKGKKALDWTCFGCKTSNYSWRGSCYRCAITRARSDTLLRESGTAEWSCRFCDVRNFPEKRVCFKCHRERREAEMGMGLRGRLGRVGEEQGRARPLEDRDGRPYFSRFSPPSMLQGGNGRYGNQGRGPARDPSPEHRYQQGNHSNGGSGDWRCGLCGTDNGVRRNDCYKCTTVRGGDIISRGNTSFVPPVPGSGGQIPDWVCPQCEISNSGWSDTCFRCKEPIQGPGRGFGQAPGSDAHLMKRSLLSTPGSSMPPAFRDPGSPKRRRTDTADPITRLGYGPDWVCRFCRLEIFPKRNDCYKCGRPRFECEDVRPRSSGGASSYADTWTTRGPDPPHNSDTWFCDTCGIGNPRSADGCWRCKTPRVYRDDGDRGGRSGNWNKHPPSRQPRHAPMATERRFTEPHKVGADWTCKFCRINNFAKRMKCFKCTKPRNECEMKYDKRGREIGPNDWVCGNSSCRESNYEWRDRCFICRSPRPT